MSTSILGTAVLLSAQVKTQLHETTFTKSLWALPFLTLFHNWEPGGQIFLLFIFKFHQIEVLRHQRIEVALHSKFIICNCNRSWANFIKLFCDTMRVWHKNNFQSLYLCFYQRFLKTSYKLLTKILRTFYKLLTNFLQTSYKLLTSFLQTSYKLLTKILWTSYNFL